MNYAVLTGEIIGEMEQLDQAVVGNIILATDKLQG